MNKTKKLFILTTCSFAICILFTLLVYFVDKQFIGPNNSAVGFAVINKFFANNFNNNFYILTKYLGYLPIILAVLLLGFSAYKIIKEKSFLKNPTLVASSIVIVATFVLYVFFEIVVINYRPVLLDGKLEVSFPSSHTLFSVSFLLISVACIKEFIKNNNLKNILSFACYLLCVVIVVGRFFSGVHWFTDILGGLLWGGFLFLLFCSLKEFLQQKELLNKQQKSQNNKN